MSQDVLNGGFGLSSSGAYNCFENVKAGRRRGQCLDSPVFYRLVPGFG